jgi:hypothetical protein
MDPLIHIRQRASAVKAKDIEMNGLFEGARQIVASEVMRLRSLGGRRHHAAQKMWLAHQTPPPPPVEDDSSLQGEGLSTGHRFRHRLHLPRLR